MGATALQPSSTTGSLQDHSARLTRPCLGLIKPREPLNLCFFLKHPNIHVLCLLSPLPCPAPPFSHRPSRPPEHRSNYILSAGIVYKNLPGLLMNDVSTKEVYVMDGQCVLFNQHGTKINKNKGRGIKLQPN